jgi:hypothetical protein
MGAAAKFVIDPDKILADSGTANRSLRPISIYHLHPLMNSTVAGPRSQHQDAVPVDAVLDRSATLRPTDMPLTSWGVTRPDNPLAGAALIFHLTDGGAGVLVGAS